MDKQVMKGRLADMRWTNAKTYQSFAPHEYIVLGKQPGATRSFFLEVAQRVKSDGVDEEFSIFGNVRTYRYLHLGGYKYWVMDHDPKDVTLINRVPLPPPAP